MKRFWDNAAVSAEGGAFSILLDGKPMRIPGGAPLHVDNAALAEAIAAEWAAAGGSKGGEMSMDDVPLTRLAGTAQDRIAPDPAPVVEALAKYAETDLLCYRAERPLPLVLRQSREWQPWLDWFDTYFGIRLLPTEGITAIAQSPDALAAVRQVIAARSPATLAGLGLAIPALGSVVLGLALAEGAMDGEAAHRTAALDELWQEEQWGADEWARKRRDDVGRDIALAARFVSLARA